MILIAFGFAALAQPLALQTDTPTVYVFYNSWKAEPKAVLEYLQSFDADSLKTPFESWQRAYRIVPIDCALRQVECGGHAAVIMPHVSFKNPNKTHLAHFRGDPLESDDLMRWVSSVLTGGMVADATNELCRLASQNPTLLRQAAGVEACFTIRSENPQGYLLALGEDNGHLICIERGDSETVTVSREGQVKTSRPWPSSEQFKTFITAHDAPFHAKLTSKNVRAFLLTRMPLVIYANKSMAQNITYLSQFYDAVNFAFVDDWDALYGLGVEVRRNGDDGIAAVVVRDRELISRFQKFNLTTSNTLQLALGLLDQRAEGIVGDQTPTLSPGQFLRQNQGLIALFLALMIAGFGGTLLRVLAR